MNRQILKILDEILPKLIRNPKLMFGHDTSSEEVDYVINNGKLPIRMLENLGGDHFFVLYAEEFGMKQKEGELLDFYLEHKTHEDVEELKKMFAFLE